MRPDMTATLVRLMYISRMAPKCGPKELQEILDISRKNNAEMGVTGALCYSAKGFLQCIEGPRKEINTLYRRIVQDHRNEEVTLISYSSIAEREFGQWTMAYVRSDEVEQAIMVKHGATAEFDPYTLNAEQALGLLKDIARERAAFWAKQQAEQGQQ